MKRIIPPALFLLFAAAALAGPIGAVAQSGPAGPRDGPEGRTVNYRLDCNGCHGDGQSPPYLGGEQFHREAHGAWQEGIHARAAEKGLKAAACLDCHSPDNRLATMLPARDPRSTVNRANVAATCGKCHNDGEAMRGTGIGNQLFVSYVESVHARAVARGKQAAVCTDCHKSHDVLPGSDPRSSIFKFNIARTCGQCHAPESREFSESVHGASLGRGNSQSPSCTDCHGVHGIASLQSSRDALRTSGCARCHEGVRLTREFGIAAERVSSFRDSYHGLARRLGSDIAADCASCHGVHNILPSDNPASTIAQGNLTQTCGQCHSGAGERFVAGKVHLNVPASEDAGSTGVRWVRWAYLVIIFGTIGGMLLHNGLSWRRKAAARLRSERRTIIRLTANQRLQHWLLLTSFIVLVVSGFVLVYPDSWLYYFALGTSEATRRMVHRAAGVVMMAVGAYHVVYLCATREGRRWLSDMLPRWKDARDLWQFFRHYLLGRGERPKFERFGYAEKAEYWAVVWGTVVMGLTGLLIWLKTSAFGFAPLWWIDVAIAVHFYEAVLATLAIIVWHFYHVFLDPDVYPVNLAFYDGRISEELYRHEHELDWERMGRAGGEGDSHEGGLGGESGARPRDGADARPDAVADAGADGGAGGGPQKDYGGPAPSPLPSGGD